MNERSRSAFRQRQELPSSFLSIHVIPSRKSFRARWRSSMHPRQKDSTCLPGKNVYPDHLHRTCCETASIDVIDPYSRSTRLVTSLFPASVPQVFFHINYFSWGNCGGAGMRFGTFHPMPDCAPALWVETHGTSYVC